MQGASGEKGVACLGPNNVQQSLRATDMLGAVHVPFRENSGHARQKQKTGDNNLARSRVSKLAKRRFGPIGGEYCGVGWYKIRATIPHLTV